MNTDQLIAILFVHQERWDSDCLTHEGCTCGYRTPNAGSSRPVDGGYGEREAWRAHLALRIEEARSS